MLTLVLAAVAWLVPTRPRAERRFFGALALVALVVALGGFTTLHGLIYRFVPGFASIRVSSRAFYLANLALAVLAAFGAESLLGALAAPELRRLRTLARAASGLLAVAGLLALILYLPLMTNYKPVGEDFFFSSNLFSRTPSADAFTLLTQTANAFLLFVLLLAASVALLWTRLSGRLVGRGLATAVALLMFVDVATFAPYHDTVKGDPATARFTIKKYATQLLKAPWQITDQQELLDRLARLPDGTRVDNAAEALPDNYSAVYRTPFATGYNILDLQQRFELLTQWPNLSPATRWDLLNVGYVLTDAESKDAPAPDAKLLVGNSQGKLWQLPKQPVFARFSTSLRPAQTSITLNGLLNMGQPIDAQPTLSLDGGALREALGRLWPEAADPALYQIGSTGKRSPVDIGVLAGGPIKYSAVIVDGVTATPEQRGIVLALVDPDTGKLRAAGGFDTYASADESDRLAAMINAAPEGTIVALATYDEGTSKLNDAARAALASVGAQTDLHDKIGAAYALIGVKGAAPGTALERLDPAAAVALDVGAGALPATPGARFSSQLLAYQPDRITLLVQNSARGLLTVSETVFPGWEAYVDGLSTPILRANGMQRAIVLPPAPDGQPHEVTFVYRPASVRNGGALAALTLAGAIGLLLAALGTELLERRKLSPAEPALEPAAAA